MDNCDITIAILDLLVGVNLYQKSSNVKTGVIGLFAFKSAMVRDPSEQKGQFPDKPEP